MIPPTGAELVSIGIIRRDMDDFQYGLVKYQLYDGQMRYAIMLYHRGIDIEYYDQKSFDEWMDECLLDALEDDLEAYCRNDSISVYYRRDFATYLIDHSQVSYGQIPDRIWVLVDAMFPAIYQKISEEKAKKKDHKAKKELRKALEAEKNRKEAENRINNLLGEVEKKQARKNRKAHGEHVNKLLDTLPGIVPYSPKKSYGRPKASK